MSQIINLTARDKSSLSRQELFCSLALVALAQSTSSDELSIEELLTSLPNLPLPQITVPSPSPQPGPGFSIDSPSAEASTSSPWDTAPRINGGGGNHYIEPSDMTTTTNGDERPGAFSVGTEKGYWKRLETVEVSLLAEREGWFLQKYKVESDVSSFY
jgi:sorting nexin-8